MGPQDGVDHAIRALAVLQERRRDWHAVFMGDGEMLDEMRALADRARARRPRRVHRLGRARHDRRVLSTSDVCLAPDPKNPLNDVSSMVKISEYMAMCRPIVSYDLPESRIGAGDAAVYAAADDVDGLRGPDRRAARRPRAPRARWAQRGRARAEGVLAWEHQERSLLRAYARALGQPAPATAAGRNVTSAALMDT